MTRHLSTAPEIEAARHALHARLAAHGEWFCSSSDNQPPVALRAGEWALDALHGRLHFSYWPAYGAHVWRVHAWTQTGATLTLAVSRRMGAARTTLTLVPRASVAAVRAAVRAARLALCAVLAQQACAELPGGRVERVRLSAGARRNEPGRYARIILRGRTPVAVTGPIIGVRAQELDALLTAALSWWLRLGQQRRLTGLRQVWLIVPRALGAPMGTRLALLRAGLRRDIRLYEHAAAEPALIPTAGPALTPTAGPALTPAGGPALTPVPVPGLAQLLAAAPRPLRRPPTELSASAARLLALAPAALDVVRAHHGETLRFHGLPCVRVRRTLGRECVWFGVGARRQLLTAANWPELLSLLTDLGAHRTASAPDPRHAYYRAAPEAWLEALLRRDITRLDPGLILAPLHAQFRTAREGRAQAARPVDLLALRRDGRLVVIELKVSAAAALPLQGADYWRRIATYHRAGHIERARLFGGAEISDEPPLVYLVAPGLRFHRSFQTLARCIAPEIEMYRFDLNEDWRAGVRVVRRMRVN